MEGRWCDADRVREGVSEEGGGGGQGGDVPETVRTDDVAEMFAGLYFLDRSL